MERLKTRAGITIPAGPPEPITGSQPSRTLNRYKITSARKNEGREANR